MKNLVGFRSLVLIIVLSFLLLPSSSGASKGKETLIIGFLEHYNDPQLTGHRVRVAFKKENGLWKAYESDFGTPAALDRGVNYFPKAVSWNTCFDGRNLGSLRSQNPRSLSRYMDVGLQDIEPDSKVPTVGDPSLLFSGFLHSPVYRPLVLNSQPYCKDSEVWKPYRPDAGEIEDVYNYLKKKFKIAHRRSAKAKVEVNKSYKSQVDEATLISLTITGAKIVPDADEFSENNSRLWCYISRGEVRYLASEMLLLDAGDYDGDGQAEVIFKIEKYNYDGYALYYDNCKKHVEFGWNYH